MPLSEPLSSLPLWSKVVASNVVTYATGQVIAEEMQGSVHTVEGKYIVYSVDSQFYHQTLRSIAAYDAKASAIKVYCLYGDGQGGNRVTEGTLISDFAKKTYTITSRYDDYQESTTGSYTDTEDVSKTLVYKSGGLFLTRELITRRVIE